MIKAGLEWFLARRGNAATCHLEAGGFVLSNSVMTHPDVQFHFLPSVIVDHGQKVAKEHAYQVRQ